MKQGKESLWKHHPMKVSYIEEDERNTELRAIFCKTDAIIPAVKIHSAAISTWKKVKEKKKRKKKYMDENSNNP